MWFSRTLLGIYGDADGIYTVLVDNSGHLLGCSSHELKTYRYYRGFLAIPAYEVIEKRWGEYEDQDIKSAIRQCAAELAKEIGDIEMNVFIQSQVSLLLVIDSQVMNRHLKRLKQQKLNACSAEPDSYSLLRFMKFAGYLSDQSSNVCLVVGESDYWRFIVLSCHEVLKDERILKEEKGCEECMEKIKQRHINIKFYRGSDLANLLNVKSVEYLIAFGAALRGVCGRN